MQYIEDERFDSRDIEILVLDEADRMLDMGFIGDVDRIAAEARWRKQTMLFSATLEGAGLKKFAEDLLKDPAELYAEPPRSERKKIQQLVYFADTAEHKFNLLKYLLQQEDVTRSIIFVKTRERLAELVSQLQANGIDCAWLRGEMEQEKRIEALNRFRSDRVKILVATDVASRGIDLPDVSHVFNYDMPRSADTYIHRIGRTGRAGKKGCAINLIEAHDVGMMERVERYAEEKMMRRVVDSMRPQHKISKPAGKRKEKKEDEKKDEKKNRKKKSVIASAKTKANQTGRKNTPKKQLKRLKNQSLNNSLTIPPVPAGGFILLLLCSSVTATDLPDDETPTCFPSITQGNTRNRPR